MAEGQGAPGSPAGGSHESGGDKSPLSGVREQDRFLPIANIGRIMKKALPANAKISRDAKETAQECVSEVISYVTSVASEKCQREKRKTTNGDDLLWAMATIGFEDYIDPLKAYLDRYREMEGGTKGSTRGANGSASSSQKMYTTPYIKKFRRPDVCMERRIDNQAIQAIQNVIFGDGETEEFSSSSSENNDRRRRSRNIISSAENRDTVNSVAINSKQRRGRVGKSVLTTSPSGKTQQMEITPPEIPDPDMVLSKLILAAKKPMQGHDDMISVVGLLPEVCNAVCLEKPGLVMDSGKYKREKALGFETAHTCGVDSIEDSYWTDRMIQTSFKDPVSFEPQKPNERGAQPDANAGVVSNLNDNRESIAMDLDVENPSAVKDDVSDNCCPIVLMLNFFNLEAIPPVLNLNEIFSRYGPLEESETKILAKGKRAKVMFKRREDAESAISSTGKYSIFGPSLISYRLNYAPNRHPTCATLKMDKMTNP